MEQAQNYRDHVDRVRSLLAERLGSHTDDADRFGHGRFVFGAEYGERGAKGDMVWYVSRDDNLLRQRLTFEWRAYTPERVAEMLLQAYEELAPFSVMKRVEATVISVLPNVVTTRAENRITFTLRDREVVLADVQMAHGRIIVSGPKQAPPLPIDLSMRFNAEAIERGARLITERLTSPYYGL
jgi:hypothetical protein